MTYRQFSHVDRFVPNRIARTKARMQMAVALLPTAPELPWQTMNSLLDEMVPPAHAPGVEPEVNFGVTVASDWHSLTWHVVDERNRLLYRLGENVQRAGAPASALLPLIQTSIELATTHLGCWCKGATSGLTAGWSLPDELPFEEAARLTPVHSAGNTIQQWARRIGVITCQQVEQSYVGAASHTALQYVLPGADTTTQLGNMLELFAELGVEGMPDRVLTAIAALLPATTALALYVELSNTGLAQIGISIPKPSLRLILHLHELNAGEKSDGQSDRLAAFQGMLGAANVDWVRCVQSAQGFHLLYTYFPLGHDL